LSFLPFIDMFETIAGLG